MSVAGYGGSTSVRQGSVLEIHVSSSTGTANVSVGSHGDVLAHGQPTNVLFSASTSVESFGIPIDGYATGYRWPVAFRIPIDPGWSSDVYDAVLDDGAGATADVQFVVRPAVPASSSPILVCLPVATSQAYNGEGGKSLYANEQPDRSHKVSFDRPGGLIGGWEDQWWSWLESGPFTFEFCSNLDLHRDPRLLAPYQLLLSIGHDEYWSLEMRDHVERFIARGGNVAFFSGNVCWWQCRFEDEGRTMVCYRDATLDPLTGIDDGRVTVRWTSAPVSRPENHMTGVSFRAGAGGWNPERTDGEYVVRFPEHWVFDGTNLNGGDTFARGCVGYETDAAELEEVDGIPRATGHDGTPSTFAILATADLTSWSPNGQGGFATMGIYRRGGTVFTAASTGWGIGVPNDPLVTQVTSTVISRLSQRYPGSRWELIGEAIDVTAMCGCQHRLFCVADQQLWWREPILQNVHWTSIEPSQDYVAMDAPLEGEGKPGIGLFAVSQDGVLWFRDQSLGPSSWQRVDSAPNVTAIACCYNNIFAADTENQLLVRDPDWTGGWVPIGEANSVVAMTNVDGQLFCVTTDGTVWCRLPFEYEVHWTAIDSVPESATALGGTDGQLFLATAEGHLWVRTARV